MPDFTVIEGGGGKDDESRDWHVVNAGILSGQQFEQLAIEMLRALARGDDQGRVSRLLLDLFSNLQLSERPVYPLVDAGIREINARLVPEDFHAYDRGLGHLLSTALRLAAERVATDGFAKGRASQRLDSFQYALEDYLIHREKRVREHGGSYLGELLGRLPPLPRYQPARQKPRKGKARRRKASVNAKSVVAEAQVVSAEDWRAFALGHYERQVLFALIRRRGMARAVTLAGAGPFTRQRLVERGFITDQDDVLTVTDAGREAAKRNGYR